MRTGWAIAAALVACGSGSPTQSNAVETANRALRVGVDGPGAVEASGLSVDCHAGCQASIPSGTVVHLVARAEPAATFVGWQGACVGTGACDHTVTGDSDVTASFSAADPCADVMPGPLGTPVSATLPPPGSKRYCEDATSDGEGNVAHVVSGMGPSIWQVYAADGTPRGSLQDALQIAEQQSGFHAIGYGGFTAWSADGKVLAQNAAAVRADSSVATWIFPARTGGSVVVTTNSWGCPNGSGGPSSLNVWRFAASGAVTSVVDVGGTGCPAGRSNAIVGVSDDHDNTFVAVMTGCCHDVFGMPARRIIARWIDAKGTPITPWTDVAPEGDTEVAFIIGGGVVFRAGEFVASFASGSLVPAAPPAFIRPYHRLAIVRGGRAYASVPIPGWATDHAIELYSAAGTHCGTLPFQNEAACVKKVPPIAEVRPVRWKRFRRPRIDQSNDQQSKAHG